MWLAESSHKQATSQIFWMICLKISQRKTHVRDKIQSDLKLVYKIGLCGSLKLESILIYDH